MKIIHVYGLSGMLFILGVMLWIMQAALLYLAWAVIAGGAAFGLIGLLRFLLPGYIQISTHRHERWKAAVDLNLRAQMVALAQRPGYGAKFDANGSIEILPQSVARVATLPKDEQEEADEQTEQSIPASVRYEDIQSQIPRGRSCLGVSENGVEHCDFGQLMTMWICGGSSTGKSNTVALKIDEAIRNGRKIGIVLVDPHARKDDSLYNKIQCYEQHFLFQVAVSEEQILGALEWFKDEFERRLQEGGQGQTDILLVVDEVSNVVESDDPEIGKLIKKIARICGQESRGFGMFGWFISQDAAGLAWLRKRAMTVIAHKLNMMSERKLACNEDLEIARDMDQWPRGRVAVYGLNFQGVMVAQMPAFAPPMPGSYMTAPETPRNAFTEPLETVAYGVPVVPPALSGLAPEQEKISAEEREHILELARAGVPRRDMCRGLGRGNGYYAVVKMVLDEEGL